MLAELSLAPMELYSLARLAKIDRRLAFFTTARKVAREKFQAITASAIRKALATAR